MLQQEFMALVARHTADQQLPLQLWTALSATHTDEARHFHNLRHLEQMIGALAPVKGEIEDWDTVLFAIFYHDSVYDVVRTVSENDNEESSAEAAAAVLQQIGYPAEKTERCQRHILATKRHAPSTDNDTNYVTDTDLSVLGQPWEAYKAYMGAIRREYEIYPDSIFHAGREVVLKRFLHSPRIYKTEQFYRQYEKTARENIGRELEIIAISK